VQEQRNPRLLVLVSAVEGIREKASAALLMEQLFLGFFAALRTTESK
jgi:hypothetical protein